jgi:hypothetical protein
VAGTILTTALALGRVVPAGDLLVELDSKPQELALGETSRQRGA